MGSRRGGDGDGTQPPDGGLPDLPPEWGVVVIPDDLHELDRESSELRRERRRIARRNRWRRRFGLPPIDPDADAPPIGAPLLVMSITIIAAVTSLLAITLSTRPVSTPAPARTAAAASTTAHQMINLSLGQADGRLVALHDTEPAVILLLDGCQCDQLIRDTARLAPTKVTVLVVDRRVPTIPAGVHVTALADPEQALLATYGGGADQNATPSGIPAAVLVDARGTIMRSVRPATKATDFETDLVRLGS
jgi:hypothetical protein